LARSTPCTQLWGVHAKTCFSSPALESSDQIKISPYQIASYYAILNKKDESFDWLEKAYTAHDAGLVAIKTDSDFDNLHSDGRFADLLRRMKLSN
jgi:hypothetical protein